MNYLVAVDDSFVDAPGGMARVAWDIALLMRDRGHRVCLLCARKSAATPLTSKTDGIEIVRYDKPALPGWHPLRAERNIRAAADTAQRVLGREKWDVVHMHSVFTGCGVARALGEGPSYVFTVHSPMVLEQQINWRSQGWTGRLKLLFGQKKLKTLEGQLLRKCAAIHTLSEYTRTQIEHFHSLGNRVTVIPYWRRAELIRRHDKHEARRLLGWPIKDKILFTVRHHGPRIGLDVAIQAIAPMAKQNRCVFMIGGDGRLRPMLEKMAKTLGAPDQIRFLGRLSNEDLRLAYEAADLFILPTRELECFGLIIIEALAYGCPVLSSDAAAIPETMQPILPDFVVPAGDVGALAQKVKEYLDGQLVPPGPDELTAYISRHFDYSVVVPQIVSLIERNVSTQEGELRDLDKR